MTDISKRLEQSLRSVIQSSPILPVKTADGILVGDVLIVSEGHLKHIQRNGQFIYREISLNAVAIKLANLLAKRSSSILLDNIYKADQEYGRWFVDSQMLRTQYQNALKAKDHDKADMLWARYQESRHRTETAKNEAQRLAAI